MKRILLAIAAGFVLVTAYTIVVSAIIVLSGRGMELVPYLDLPMRLPKAIFFYVFPPTAEDFTPVMNQKKILLGVSLYIANVLLYSIPAYLIITLISRRKRKVEPAQPEQPPPPPSFVN